MQILFARQQQASSWFNPELLAMPLETIRGWMEADPELAVYRFAVESLFHEQEHVLDERASACCRSPAASTACRTTATPR